MPASSCFRPRPHPGRLDRNGLAGACDRKTRAAPSHRLGAKTRRMKIAYLGQMADVSRETSIAKKIRAQCLAWQTAGHTVRYFALTPTPTVWSGFAPVTTN